MTELVKYEAARQALAEAVAVDEVLQIRSKAEALRHYARQAGDKGLEIQAAQIRFRAERKMGELLIAAKDAGQVREGRPKNRSDKEQFSAVDGGALAEAEAALDELKSAPIRVTLEQAGIDRKLSMRAQRVAAMDAAEFEAALAQHAEEMRAGQGRVAMDLLKIGAEEKGRAHRRDLAQALSDQAAELPAGRVFPAAYIDCPWERKGGIGDRAYENHYPTMTWPEILAYLRKARGSLLPDSWAFFWIPRAHLLALVEVETEVTVAETGERVIAKVDMPLAWAVGQALGMDAYSTCFVWTKTDEDHPDASGSGLIAWDQDELLLLFKRGRGLPKPSGAEKYGSNHRERATDHSRKPEHYRRMIRDMVGGLPVLEMFARVDADHPLPAGWAACGNQAGAPAVEPAAEIVLEESEKLDGTLVQTVRGPDGREILREVVSVPSLEAPIVREITIAASIEAQPAFPPTEYADLLALAEGAELEAGLVARLPDYARRGLADDALGRWRLSGAGKVRLEVVEREWREREAQCKQHLDETEFWDWRDLARLAGGQHLDSASVRSLVGLDLAACTDDRVYLTFAGKARLAELEAIVDRTIGRPVAVVAEPKQVDLEQVIADRGAADPLDLPLFLRRAPV